MHDLFEGVAQYEMKLLLNHCISEKYFTLSEFNASLLNFEYGFSELADKPVPITTQHLRSKDGKHIRQGSAQMWLFLGITPFLIASKVPEADLYWECYLKLMKTVDIVVAPIVSKDVCAVLKNLIEEHHTMFTELYPDATVTPKWHYMIHYPEQILAMGRLIRAWAMRLEAKLHLLKNAGRVSNFKNISQSIAFRHQRLMCYELSSGSVLSSPIECGPSSSTTPQLVPDISNDVLVSRIKWVKIHGILYKPMDTYLLCAVDDLQLAECTMSFGCVQEILAVIW